MNVKIVKQCSNQNKAIVASIALMVQYLALQFKKVGKVHVVGSSNNKNNNTVQSYRHADVSVYKGSLRQFQKNLHTYG